LTPPGLAAARHVVLGDAGAEALRCAGAGDVVVLRDRYPEVLRAADPGGSAMGGQELARALARRPRRPVVAWTAPGWAERLAVAFAAEALAAAPEARLASARSPGASACPPAQLARALARAVRPGPELTAMARLWRAAAPPRRALAERSP
jgi:hypothetical protein